MLAIVFGCHKFHDYTYGLTTVFVETGHKPLESILRNPLYTAPAKLQRMIMSIQRYAIQVTYRPSKELLIADALSRTPLTAHADELEFNQYDINILHTLPITETKLKEFQQTTESDSALSDLASTVLHG